MEGSGSITPHWAEGYSQEQTGGEFSTRRKCRGKLLLQADSFQTDHSLPEEWQGFQEGDKPTSPNRWDTHSSSTSEPERKPSPQVKIILLFESPERFTCGPS